MLTVTDIEVFYGASQALYGISLAVDDGEVVTLLGRNGMGKSTTLRAIAGLNPPAAGSIRFRDRQTNALPSYRIARLGIGWVPEGRRIFPNLTVRENLVAAAVIRPGTVTPWTLARIYELLPKLKDRETHMGDQLSGGEQQMLAIGRALMTNPSLLLLDEATEGLAPLVREEVWRCLRRLKAARQSILVVDKNLNALAELADRHYVMENGRIVWQGDSRALRANEAIAHRYLGV